MQGDFIAEFQRTQDKSFPACGFFLMVDWGHPSVSSVSPAPGKAASETEILRNLSEKVWRKRQCQIIDMRETCRVQVCLREPQRRCKVYQIQRSEVEQTNGLQRRHWGQSELSAAHTKQSHGELATLKRCTPEWNLLMLSNVGPPRPAAWLYWSLHL